MPNYPNSGVHRKHVAKPVKIRQLDEESNFEFHWPSGNIETYEKCIRYELKDPPIGCQNGEIYVATGWRDAYGAKRRRILVFRPRQTVLAEFVGVDDWDTTHDVAWVIKETGSNSDIKFAVDIPHEFKEFTIARFDSWVTGPYARRGFGIRLHENDHKSMIKASLFREKYKQYRSTKSGPKPTQELIDKSLLSDSSKSSDPELTVERMWHIAEEWRGSNNIYRSSAQGRRYRIHKVTERNIEIERMDGGEKALLRLATAKRLAPIMGLRRHLRGKNLSVAARTTFEALWLAAILKPDIPSEQRNKLPLQVPKQPGGEKDHYPPVDKGTKISVTHGGRRKAFKWRLAGNNILIKSVEGIEHSYSLVETFTIIRWLKDQFGAGWFPLANNVELLGNGVEKDGLGMAILNLSPDDVSHAQGSSYFGVVLEEIGLFEWNGEKRGIQWRIVKMPDSVSVLKQIVKYHLG